MPGAIDRKIQKDFKLVKDGLQDNNTIHLSPESVNILVRSSTIRYDTSIPGSGVPQRPKGAG